MGKYGMEEEMTKEPTRLIVVWDYTTGGCCGHRPVQLDKGDKVWTFPRPPPHQNRTDSCICCSRKKNKEPHFLLPYTLVSPDGKPPINYTGRRVTECQWRDRQCPVCHQRRRYDEFELIRDGRDFSQCKYCRRK